MRLLPVLLCLLLSYCNCLGPLSLFGSKYLFSSISYPSSYRAGRANRAEYARMYGRWGETLIRIIGEGHTRTDVPIEHIASRKIRKSDSDLHKFNILRILKKIPTLSDAWWSDNYLTKCQKWIDDFFLIELLHSWHLFISKGGHR